MPTSRLLHSNAFQTPMSFALTVTGLELDAPELATNIFFVPSLLGGEGLTS